MHLPPGTGAPETGEWMGTVGRGSQPQSLRGAQMKDGGLGCPSSGTPGPVVIRAACPQPARGTRTSSLPMTHPSCLCPDISIAPGGGHNCPGGFTLRVGWGLWWENEVCLGSAFIVPTTSNPQNAAGLGLEPGGHPDGCRLRGSPYTWLWAGHFPSRAASASPPDGLGTSPSLDPVFARLVGDEGWEHQGC